MAVKSKEEMLASLNTILGENTSDEALAILEDISDTYDDYDRRTNGEDWETRYHELDDEWRNRYRERFNEPYNDDNDNNNNNTINNNKPLRFENLFKEE